MKLAVKNCAKQNIKSLNKERISGSFMLSILEHSKIKKIKR